MITDAIAPARRAAACKDRLREEVADIVGRFPVPGLFVEDAV